MSNVGNTNESQASEGTQEKPKKFGQRLKSFWKQRVLGYPADDFEEKDRAAFDKKWFKGKDEKISNETLQDRRSWLRKGLERDLSERIGSLRSIAQEAGATANVVALLLVGFGLIAQIKTGAFEHNPQARAMSWLVGLAVLFLTKAYMPKFFKAWGQDFEGAGKWAAENYTSEYDYVHRIRKDLNIRNGILQRARRALSIAHVFIKLGCVLMPVFITFG